MRGWCCLVPLVLLFSACHMRRETPADHAVHKGEAALLIVSHHDHAYCAVAHPYAHALATAVDAEDAAGVQSMLDTGKALAMDNQTKVKVVGESFNEREIQVLDGPMQGKKGWVPLEWLLPVV